LEGSETIDVEDFGEAPPLNPFMSQFLTFKLNSVKNIMPSQYVEMAERYFAEDFKNKTKYDLNGATIWHKIVVISPIKDLDQMLDAEEDML
jgi:hypothetical protein